MSRFIIRVELQEGKDCPYSDLHRAMESSHFIPHIEMNGVKYALPAAEYSYVSDSSIEIVRDLALAVAKSFTRNYNLPEPAILVIKVDGNLQWYNLKPLKS